MSVVTDAEIMTKGVESYLVGADPQLAYRCHPRISSGAMARPLQDGIAQIGLGFIGKAKLETYVSEFD